MKDWLKFMKPEELIDLQTKLGKVPWTPPDQEVVARMLQEIRIAQSERANLDRAELCKTLRKAADMLEKGRA
jgi:hypothetical protein